MRSEPVLLIRVLHIDAATSNENGTNIKLNGRAAMQEAVMKAVLERCKAK
jgi:hypothetical protein